MGTKMSKSKGVLIGLMSGVTWGVYTVFLSVISGLDILTKFQDPYSSSVVVATLGAIMSAVLSMGYLVLKGHMKEFLTVMRTKNALMILASATLAGPLAMTAYASSTSMSGATLSSAVSALYPIIAMLLAVCWKTETLTKTRFVGVVVATFGTCILGYMPGDSSVHLIGISLAFIAAVGWAFEGVIGAKVMETVTPAVAICMRQIFSMVTYVAVVIPLMPNTAEIYSTVGSIFLMKDYFVVLVLIGLFSTSSYIMWYESLHALKVSTAMILNVTYTLWAMVFDVIINHAEISKSLLIGSVVLTLGTMIVVSQEGKDTECEEVAD